jgi:hypothetical protein
MQLTTILLILSTTIGRAAALPAAVAADAATGTAQIATLLPRPISGCNPYCFYNIVTHKRQCICRPWGRPIVPPRIGPEPIIGGPGPVVIDGPVPEVTPVPDDTPAPEDTSGGGSDGSDGTTISEDK